MKRSIPYMIGILIIAIVLQVAWNQLKSDGNNKQTGETEHKESKSMKDLLLDDKDESEIDIHQAIEQMKQQPEKVAIPNESEDMYDMYIHYQKEEENVSQRYSYYAEELDRALVFLNIETANDDRRESEEERIDEPLSFEYKGFVGLIGYEKNFDDSIVIFAEKDGYFYEYRVFRPLEKADWKGFYETELDRLSNSHDTSTVNDYLDLTDEQLDKVIYPYFTSEVRKVLISLDNVKSIGPTLEVFYYVNDRSSMQYTIYFDNEKAKKFIDEDYFTTVETPGGVEVQVLDKDSDHSMSRYYYYWEMNGMTLAISYGENDKDLDDEGIFTLIDSLADQK